MIMYLKRWDYSEKKADLILMDESGRFLSDVE
jgi:hypothetical protein